MSRPLKEFKNLTVREGQASKLWKTHTPGTRIAPPQSGNKDKNWQLCLDAGEVKEGKKRKNSSHANLAVGDINVDESEDNYPDAFDNLWDDIEKQAKDKLG
ncbi:hypothetical protein BDV33DRAFT_205549 [Aspergillus novoparasiticus]|uniref:Uncharacterized protein n=1 Tax=Aspergillus novoparasiticus TaxID=986946 RepID=A0A5N6EL49_9EURO|nr:hypothetical protein BDV33DRAFT_205549 [Aspergillus novoparasiticus]